MSILVVCANMATGACSGSTMVMEMSPILLRIEESHASAYSLNGHAMFPFAVFNQTDL